VSSWARVGAKCVFIGGGYRHDGWNYPVANTVYTVRSARVGLEGLILLLNEVRNIVQSNGVEPGFGAYLFKPVIDISDDIALFHAPCPGLPVVPPAVVPKRQSVTSRSD